MDFWEKFKIGAEVGTKCGRRGKVYKDLKKEQNKIDKEEIKARKKQRKAK